MYHFIDVALANSFILRKKVTDNPKLPLYEYKLAVATALMYAENLSAPGRADIPYLDVAAERAANGDPVGGADPTDAVRTDGHNHWPEFAASKPRRCKLQGCKVSSTVWCTKCKVYLCLKGRKNCFVEYHQ